MLVDLTQAEREFLNEVLIEHNRVLLHEISRTDHKEYKLRLLEKERLLESLRNKLAVQDNVAA